MAPRALIPSRIMWVKWNEVSRVWNAVCHTCNTRYEEFEHGDAVARTRGHICRKGDVQRVTIVPAVRRMRPVHRNPLLRSGAQGVTGR